MFCLERDIKVYLGFTIEDMANYLKAFMNVGLNKQLYM